MEIRVSLVFIDVVIHNFCIRYYTSAQYSIVTNTSHLHRTNTLNVKKKVCVCFLSPHCNAILFPQCKPQILECWEPRSTIYLNIASLCHTKQPCLCISTHVYPEERLWEKKSIHSHHSIWYFICSGRHRWAQNRDQSVTFGWHFLCMCLKHLLLQLWVYQDHTTVSPCLSGSVFPITHVL